MSIKSRMLGEKYLRNSCQSNAAEQANLFKYLQNKPINSYERSKLSQSLRSAQLPQKLAINENQPQLFKIGGKPNIRIIPDDQKSSEASMSDLFASTGNTSMKSRQSLNALKVL